MQSGSAAPARAAGGASPPRDLEDSREEGIQCRHCGEVGCDEDHLVAVVPGVYVGALYHANDAKQLLACRVGMVVNVAAELAQMNNTPIRVCRMVLPWDDASECPIHRDFDLVADTIHAFRHSHPDLGVLVHCMMGRSRSVSAIIAYLLKHHPRINPHVSDAGIPYDKGGLEALVGRPTCDEALATVRRARSCAQPNPGFVDQLDQYARILQWRRFLALVAPACPHRELCVAYLGSSILASPWRPRRLPASPTLP